MILNYEQRQVCLELKRKMHSLWLKTASNIGSRWRV